MKVPLLGSPATSTLIEDPVKDMSEAVKPNVLVAKVYPANDWPLAKVNPEKANPLYAVEL